VSRRHARIQIEDDTAVIEDLGSVHGVLVNGTAVAGRQRLNSGDVITIGVHELRLAVDQSIRPPPRKGRKALDAIWDDDEGDYGDGPPTQRESLVVLVAADVARLLEAGQVDQAARVFESALDATLNVAQRTGQLKTEANAQASDLALRLARATGERRWVDQLLALQVATKQTPPRQQLGRLAAAVAEVGTTEVEALRACVERARAAASPPDDAATAALDRLEGAVRALSG
jgi:hypothetical protein